MGVLLYSTYVLTAVPALLCFRRTYVCDSGLVARSNLTAERDLLYTPGSYNSSTYTRTYDTYR